MDELERLHENRNNSQYVIAILGGSVADQLAKYIISHPKYFEQLREAIPEIGDRPIRVVNLALGGYKQPQQFIVASYFVESLDLTVNVDGLNEIAAQDLSPLYPTDFPHLTLRLYARDGFRFSPFPRRLPKICLQGNQCTAASRAHAGQEQFIFRHVAGRPQDLVLGHCGDFRAATSRPSASRRPKARTSAGLRASHARSKSGKSTSVCSARWSAPEASRRTFFFSPINILCIRSLYRSRSERRRSIPRAQISGMPR